MGLISLIVIALTSIIPIWQTWGRLKIGGDVILPLIPENLSNLGYQWMDTANGLYASNDYFYWIKSFLLFKKLGLDIYTSGFIYQFLIFFLAGLGIYSLFNLFNTKSRLWGLIPAILFIYSPHLLDHMIYFQATACSIWLFYILFRFLKYKSVRWFDPILIAGIVPFIGNLPNPKYHFLIFLTYVVTIALARHKNIITHEQLKKSAPYGLAVVALTAFIWLPFIFFGVNFASDDSLQVRIRQGYQKTGVAIDYGGTFISKMFTLFHTPNLNPNDIELIHKPPFFIAFYTIAGIVLCGSLILLMHKKNHVNRPVLTVMYTLAIIFLFLSKSSNPPFGYFYELMLTSAKIFAFMRTTAGLVIYAGIFYALLFGYVVQALYYKVKSPAVPTTALAIILIAGFPILSGKYFLNQSTLNQYIDKTQHGIRIPEGYMDSARFMAQSDFDGKLKIHPGVAGYQNNTWGYYGFNMFPWMFKQSVIGVDPADPVWSPRNITNFRYILHDKTLFQDGGANKFDNQKDAIKIFNSREVDIYRVKDEDYTPYITVPKETTIANVIPKNYFDTYSPRDMAIYLLNQPVEKLNGLPEKITDFPVIEYRKINPTKYRIRIHGAKGIFPLIFQDAYHLGWKLYMNDNPDIRKGELPLNYHPSGLDAANAPSGAEIAKATETGELTNLTKDKKEFVSKKFWTTYQNNYLPYGNILETWGKKTVDENKHLKVNAFANSWTIDVDEICKNQSVCRNSKSGGEDFELIAEFFPQQIEYIAITISLSGLFIYLLFLIRKNKNGNS